jgi:integrase
MTKQERKGEKKQRRTRGEGGVRWSEARQRWIAEKTVGYDARGKRIVRTGSGTSQTAALRDLRRRVKDYEAGLIVGSEHYRVRQAVEDWLRFGQGKAGESTRKRNHDLCKAHVIPKLGERKLKELEASEVDLWLEGLSELLATSTLHKVHSCLNRSVKRDMKRGLVERNVVTLCEVPTGRIGRPSKSLTLDQARDVLMLTDEDQLHCYIVTSLLTGARTEEVRALRWRHVHLDGDPKTLPPTPPHLEVWRSVRSGGDTKTKKSRRTLALPGLVVSTLREHRSRQESALVAGGRAWDEDALVFATAEGTEMDAANVRRDFRRALRLVATDQKRRQEAGGQRTPPLNPSDWTPRELRHSFVSLLSDSGLSIEDISRLVGHKGTHVTELIYRKQLRPVIEQGATAMDALFDMPADGGRSA